MADLLIYWRDSAASWPYQFADERAWYRHSSAKVVGELQAGDRMWMVTSGKAVWQEAEQAAYLVAVDTITNTPERAGAVSITDEHGKPAGFSVPDHET